MTSSVLLHTKMSSVAPSRQGTAVVFPGQGAQRPGMGRDFCEAFAASRDVFSEASEALGLDITGVCAGAGGQLELTEFAQPAILTTEIAIYRTLEQEYGLRASYFGGHSLGEYTALCAAGVIPLADAVRIVRRRGAAMQRAVPVGVGGMLVVSGTDAVKMREVALEFDLDIASINSIDQVVLSGAVAALERVERALDSGTYRVTRLEVSAPFHSRFMKTIESELQQELKSTQQRWTPAAASCVVSNSLAEFHAPDSQAIANALVRQISAPVRWLENMTDLASVADQIFELGPSRPLRGLFQSIGRTVRSVTTTSSAEREFRA